MALNRIIFNATATIAGGYSLPLNPSELDLKNNDQNVPIKMLDSGYVIQSPVFANEPFVMRWSRIPDGFSNLSTMLSTLKGYVGSIKYVNFRDVDYRVDGTVWNKVLVGDVDVSLESGGALKYNIEIVLYPEV